MFNEKHDAMAISRMLWFTGNPPVHRRELEGYDIHILYGDGGSIRLDKILFIFDETQGNSAEEIAGSASLKTRYSIKTIEFTPRFKGTRTGNTFTGHGVTV